MRVPREAAGTPVIQMDRIEARNVSAVPGRESGRRRTAGERQPQRRDGKDVGGRRNLDHPSPDGNRHHVRRQRRLEGPLALLQQGYRAVVRSRGLLVAMVLVSLGFFVGVPFKVMNRAVGSASDIMPVGINLRIPPRLMR